MTPENFVYWLQGYLELTAKPALDEAQVVVIQEHIALVLTKKTADIPLYVCGPVNGHVMCTDKIDENLQHFLSKGFDMNEGLVEIVSNASC